MKHHIKLSDSDVHTVLFALGLYRARVDESVERLEKAVAQKREPGSLLSRLSSVREKAIHVRNLIDNIKLDAEVAP